MISFQKVIVGYIDEGLGNEQDVSDQFSERTEFNLAERVAVRDPQTGDSKVYFIKRITFQAAIEDATSEYPQGYEQRTWLLGLTVALQV